MIAELLVDAFLMCMKVFVVVIVLPTYAVVICLIQLWLERGNIYNYFFGK